MAIIEWIRKYLNLIYIMIFRDIRAIYALFTFQIKFFFLKKQNKVVLDFFDENVRKFPDKVAIIHHDQQLTFKDVANLANKISNWIESTLQLGRDDQWELFHKVSVDNNNNDSKQKNLNLNNDEDNSEIHQKLVLQNQSTQIGLMFGNVPEMASFIIGIARVRCSSVLFNIHHRRDTLINAFRATNCQAFIFDSIYLDAIKDIAHDLPDIRFFMYQRNNPKNEAIDNNDSQLAIDFNYNGLTPLDFQTGTGLIEAEQFSKLLNQYPTTPVRKNYPYNMNDMLQYVFTSGTTGGMVKAAPADNIRHIASYFSQTKTFKINPKDNVYICLPLYHSFAGITGLGYLYIGGTTLTLADKFSASRFWLDCCRYKCTAAIYIGEVCRYLLAQPDRPEEREHSLRIMIGSGLKKEIWSEFQKRFNIKQIGEYYGSTEGNIQVFNLDNKEGSCGFIPYYYGFITRFCFHIYLIKIDPFTMELVRDSKGFCKFAKPGEDGMLVGVIRKGMVFAEFLGYTNKQESSKKLIRNVRRKGDCAFVSGDLMVMDFYGYLYFKDRTGDTFRWKGENVSTTEIETIAAKFFEHQDCVVYGVQVPNCDGRAGMMAIKANKSDGGDDEDQQTFESQIDLQEFYKFMRARVPEYAIPKFIRITDTIQTTSTLKYMKYPLREAGFDLQKMKPNDRLFYFDRPTGKYLPLDQDAYQKILDDFDYVTGRRLERNQHNKNHNNRKLSRRSEKDRPKHLPKLCRDKNSLTNYTKVLQKKCYNNQRNTKFTFCNQPFHSRLTLEPKLSILQPSINDAECQDQIKLKLGIFSNSKSATVTSNKIKKSKNLIENDWNSSVEKKNYDFKSRKKPLTTTIEPVFDEINVIDDSFNETYDDAISNKSINREDENIQDNVLNLSQSIEVIPKNTSYLQYSPIISNNDNQFQNQINESLRQPDNEEDETPLCFEDNDSPLIMPIFDSDDFSESFSQIFNNKSSSIENSKTIDNFSPTFQFHEQSKKSCHHCLDIFPKDFFDFYNNNDHHTNNLNFFNDPILSNQTKIKQILSQKLIFDSDC